MELTGGRGSGEIITLSMSGGGGKALCQYGGAHGEGEGGGPDAGFVGGGGVRVVFLGGGEGGNALVVFLGTSRVKFVFGAMLLNITDCMQCCTIRLSGKEQADVFFL